MWSRPPFERAGGADPVDGRGDRRVIALAAGGRRFDDALADELAAEPEITLLCGRYEGFDERVHDQLATDVVSIGPYVLAGGELAAMVVCDAVLRKLPEPSAMTTARPRNRSAPRSRDRRIPALHASGRVARARRAGRAAFRRSCPRARVAPHAEPRARLRERLTRRRARGSGLATIRRRAVAAPASRPLFAMSGVIDSIERAQLRRVPLFQAAIACGSISRSWRERAGGRRCSRASSSSGRARRPRDLYRSQAVLRCRRRAHVPAPLAEDRADRGGGPRRRAPRQAVLPARSGRPPRAGARAPVHRAARGSRGRRGGRGGLQRKSWRTRPGPQAEAAPRLTPRRTRLM